MKKLILAALIFTPLIANAEVSVLKPDMLNIPDALKKELIERKVQQETKGYYETTPRYADYLKSVKSIAKREIRAFSKADQYDTHLKSSYKDILLAFDYVPKKDIDNEQTIAYAPIGSYVKEKGWTGIKVIFEKDFGTCSYSYFNLKLSNGFVDLNQDFTTYKVNKKPSTESVEGNKHDGFVYSLDWYTKDSMSQLECLNSKFDKSIMQKLIALANKIDNS